MVRNIIYLLGSFTSYFSLARILAENRDRLHAEGILYPDTLALDFATPFLDQSRLYTLAHEVTNPLPGENRCFLDFYIHQLQEAAKASSLTDTICLCTQLYPRRTPMDLKAVWTLCRKIFPKARQRVFVSFARQDLELMYFHNYEYLFRPNHARPTDRFNQEWAPSFCYQPILATLLHVFGKNNVVSCHI